MPKIPPREFWNKYTQLVKSENPEYSEEQVRKTVGAMWYHRIGKDVKAKYEATRKRRESYRRRLKK